jgi:hypothetical protein
MNDPLFLSNPTMRSVVDQVTRGPKLRVVGGRALSDDSQATFHRRLGRFNAKRLAPSTPASDWESDVRLDAQVLVEEGQFLERERLAVLDAASTAPLRAGPFIEWFERLTEIGPGQGDPLFSWLAEHSTLTQMRWFLTQEAAGEAGFDDLVALTQVRLPVRAKLEMARNYWDEMGRGHERGMHGPMLAKTVAALDLEPDPGRTVWESLALANLMVGLAANRRYAYHAVGALGVIEMTAPGRVSCVNEGLMRLGVDAQARMYFQLHATLDIKHSQAWNREVIAPLVETHADSARAMAEGALMRLACGARCFARYRRHFGLAPATSSFSVM